MEHILQFAINIDDDTIKKNIEQSASDKIVQEIVSTVKAKLIGKWGDLTDDGKDIIKEAFEENKDEIVDKAVNLLVNSIKNTKKYKQIINEALEEAADDGK